MQRAETYGAAMARIFAALPEHGYVLSSPTLKVRHATHRATGARLWFHPQAVYLGVHSLHLDVRGMPLATFLAHVQARTR